MTIEKRHDDCPTCDRMAREAKRTAVELGRDSWVSEDGPNSDPRRHWAVYSREQEEA